MIARRARDTENHTQTDLLCLEIQLSEPHTIYSNHYKYRLIFSWKIERAED